MTEQPDSLYFPWERDRQLARKLCDLYDVDIYNERDFILEGGSIHSNGAGTILTTELERSTDIGLCVDNSDNRIMNRTSILGVDFTGVDVNRLPVGIYIEKRADGTIRKVLNK